jgi:predicted transcriptional regulator
MRKRTKFSLTEAHRRDRRERRGSDRVLDTRGLDIIRHTLSFLVDDGLVASSNLEALVDRAAQSVSTKMSPPAPLPPTPQPQASVLQSPPSLPKKNRPAKPEGSAPGVWTGPPEFHIVAGDVAESLAKKWGSARAALDRAVVYGERAGKKATWLKVLEEMALKEERASSSDGTVPKNFSHILRTPKVPVSQSVTDDYLICLVDGAPRKHLASYILAKFGMTPEDYKRHFSLPEDYPMSAGRRPRPSAATSGWSRLSMQPPLPPPEDSNKRHAPHVEAQLWVKEWGSAQVAFRKAILGREGPGRKPVWLKRLGELADAEQRAEAAKRPPDEYAFSHIPREPVIPIKRSLTQKHIICLIDGCRKVFLTRYLLAKFGMTPQDYRIHFGLPSDYPMTSSGYRDTKSQLAVNQGLGRGVTKVPKARR